MPQIIFEHFDTFWMKKKKYSVEYTYNGKSITLDEFLYDEDGMELKPSQLSEPLLEEIYEACEKDYESKILNLS